MVTEKVRFPDTDINRIKKTFLVTAGAKGIESAFGYLYRKFFAADQTTKKELVDFANDVSVHLAAPPWNPHQLTAEINLECYEYVNA